MLDAAYYALKASNPKNIVVGGMTFFGGATRTPLWIKYLRLPNGKPPHMDWYGHNPFEERFPNIRAKPIKQLRGVSDLDTLSGGGQAPLPAEGEKQEAPALPRQGLRQAAPASLLPPPLGLQDGATDAAVAERVGIQTDRASYIFPYFVSRARQVDYLKAAFALARSLPYVKGMGWYQLIDYPPTPSNNPTWGLLEYDGDPKPVFDAYKSLP